MADRVAPRREGRHSLTPRRRSARVPRAGDRARHASGRVAWRRRPAVGVAMARPARPTSDELAFSDPQTLYGRRPGGNALSRVTKTTHARCRPRVLPRV